MSKFAASKNRGAGKVMQNGLRKIYFLTWMPKSENKFRTDVHLTMGTLQLTELSCTFFMLKINKTCNFLTLRHDIMSGAQNRRFSVRYYVRNLIM